MRRTTSTWTAAIVGAALSAQTVPVPVSAQQSPTAATARTAAKTEAEPDVSFGMAAARGARNLLRNGLDYIDYQEFDRALKYLREAEKRQNELNEPEKLKLKEGIERAQRGLREAIGSATPYALSERTRDARGDARANAGSTAVAASSRRFATARPLAAPAPAPAPTREGDDRGEPIQLTAAEAALAPPPPSRRDADIPAEPGPFPAIPETPGIELSAAPTPTPTPVPAPAAPLELADVEVPTPPPVNRIESAPLTVAAAPAPQPAPEPAAPATTEADLLAPLPDFEAMAVTPPPLGPIAPTADAAVRLSESNQAPAPILLENPNEPTAPPAAPAPPAPEPAAPAPPAELDAFNLPPLGGDAARSAAPAPAPIATPEAPAPRMTDSELDLPALPADLGATTPAPTVQPTIDEPASEPKPKPEPEPKTDAMPQPAPIAAPVADEPEAADELPELPGSMNAEAEAPRVAAATDAEPVAPAPAAEEPLAPAAEELPELPAPVAEELPELPAPATEPAPVAAPETLPTPAPEPASAPSVMDLPAPRRGAAGSSLSPELQRRVEEVARKMEAETSQRELANATQQPPADVPPRGHDADLDELRAQTQIDISRAPSPAEARPIAAIPVPEDWVPLGTREWSPQRKYWAAAATCHMPLYFQDPMLERYGHNVEKFIGPAGRFFSYPVDNHKQTTQRNQMAQPFASIGLFAFQILTLPYAMVVDPPWESQYDLGYWRPGDKIPNDLYYLPLTGTGPPLKGRQY